MKHIIDKQFDFCYGHRVHNQRLDTRFTESGDACLKCRHIHGHQGKIKIFLAETITGKNIESTGMVTDFKHLGWFKNFVDDVIDHKMILDIKDPLIGTLANLIVDCRYELDLSKCIEFENEKYWIPNLTYIKNILDKDASLTNDERDAIFEMYEGFVFVDFVPTSENLSAWMLEIARNKMKDLDNVEVVAVEYWETPKSHCRVEI